MNTKQERSIPADENYATYLGLPLLGLNKYSFGQNNFVDAYFTENGKIVACIRYPPDNGAAFWEHPNYLTDMIHESGTAILYSCPEQFEEDVSRILQGKYSKISDLAKQFIYEHSGLGVDFTRKDKKVVSSPLIHSLRYTKEDERELPLREQDILDNVDSDITFDTNGYKEGAGRV